MRGLKCEKRASFSGFEAGGRVRVLGAIGEDAAVHLHHFEFWVSSIWIPFGYLIPPSSREWKNVPVLMILNLWNPGR